MNKTKVAVIGVGHIGRHHARNLSLLSDVELVAVVDANEQAARAVAEQTGTVALADPKDLLGKVDAVCVAVPTVAHLPVAREFLKRGIATLIEKPLAFSVEEARLLVDMAQDKKAILQVGHIERYNPVWTAAENADLRPRCVETRRFSPFPFRSLDVDVVFDIMIHDIDLVLALVDSPIKSIDAVGSRVLSPSTDQADVRIQFTNGAWATLSASRVHHESVRQMRLWDEVGSLDIDFGKRTSALYQLAPTIHHQPRSFPAVMTPEQRTAALQEMFHLESTVHDRAVEPLRLELEDFVRCVREGDTPKLDGEQGYSAVVVASRINARLALAEQPSMLRKTA